MKFNIEWLMYLSVSLLVIMLLLMVIMMGMFGMAITRWECGT